MYGRDEAKKKESGEKSMMKWGKSETRLLRKKASSTTDGMRPHPRAWR